jgi:riboflavin kinase/FMN adenylyltransferase
MKVIDSLNDIPRYKKPVVAIGVFDGLHQAHRIILRKTQEIARRISGTSIVLTFWPHPQGQSSLYSLEHRLRLIEELGLDVCIVIRFNQKFARITAQDFIRNILVRKIHSRYVCVGSNFRFGRNISGSPEMLRESSRAYGFKLKVLTVIKRNSRIVSSTYIRKLITQGKLNRAERLLLRPVSVLGQVTRGRSLATRLGYPTANINPHHEVLPPSGVYAARVIFEGKKLKGICYVGNRPTIKAQNVNRKAKNKKTVEVHIFGLRRNLYRKNLEVQFIRKIRDRKSVV